MKRLLLVFPLLVLSLRDGVAQGTLSVQGFGYPAGGLSASAQSTGGGFSQFDYASTRNPSALLGWGTPGMYVQYDPEFRTVSSDGKSDHTTTVRFPMMMAAMRFGPRVMAAVSANTFLDRTFATIVRNTQVVGSDSIGYDESVVSAGAINDLRLAAGISLSDAFSIGIGIHGLTGENRLSLVRTYDDTLTYGTLIRRLTLSYLGNAVSLGATWRPTRTLALGASTRFGGKLDMRVGDSIATHGYVPDEYGVAVRYDGLPGASLGLSLDHTSWTRMDELSSATLYTRDTWDLGVGVELAGPRMNTVPVLVHLGFRNRDLPFSITPAAVKENTISAGVSLPIGGPRTVFDFGLRRAQRSGEAGVSEHAWIISAGLTVRP